MFVPGPSTFIGLRKRSTLRLTHKTCTSASTIASKIAASTAPPTIAMRCGDATARWGPERQTTAGNLGAVVAVAAAAASVAGGEGEGSDDAGF